MKIRFTFQTVESGVGITGNGEFHEEIDVPVSVEQSPTEQREYAIDRGIEAAWFRHPHLDATRWAITGYEVIG